MISQISSAAGAVQLNPAQTVQPSDVRQQKSAELPHQQVNAVATNGAGNSAKTASSSSEVDVATAKSSAAQINKVLQQMNTSIQFSVDDDTKANVVKVIDSDTKEVIRQIPTKQMLEIAKALDNLQGLLLKDKA